MMPPNIHGINPHATTPTGTFGLKSKTVSSIHSLHLITCHEDSASISLTILQQRTTDLYTERTALNRIFIQTECTDALHFSSTQYRLQL